MPSDHPLAAKEEVCLEAVSYTHLLTFRTSKEGGEKEISVSDYAALNIAAAQSGYVDLIDVEAFTGDDVVKTIIDAAHEAGVKVIASNHDFFKTPEKEEIIRRLRMMQDFGADIPKMAVMPTCKQDVLTLLSATLETVSYTHLDVYKRQNLNREIRRLNKISITNTVPIPIKVLRPAL